MHLNTELFFSHQAMIRYSCIIPCNIISYLFHWNFFKFRGWNEIAQLATNDSLAVVGQCIFYIYISIYIYALVEKLLPFITL